MLAQRGGRRGRPPGHDVGRQSAVPVGAGVNDRHGLADGGAALQHRLDLAQLDAEAAHLHLVVEHGRGTRCGRPADAGPGRRCGTSAPRLAGERVGRKTLRGQFRTIQIAARHSVAADVQLAGHAERDGPPVRVEDVDPRVGDGPADGDAAAGPPPRRARKWTRSSSPSGRRCSTAIRNGSAAPRPAPAAAPRRRTAFSAGRRRASRRRSASATSPASPASPWPRSGPSTPPDAGRRPRHRGRPKRRGRPRSAAGTAPAPRCRTTVSSRRPARRRPRGPVLRAIEVRRLTTARCGTTTPLVRPVEPEVYST